MSYSLNEVEDSILLSSGKDNEVVIFEIEIDFESSVDEKGNLCEESSVYSKRIDLVIRDNRESFVDKVTKLGKFLENFVKKLEKQKFYNINIVSIKQRDNQSKFID